MTLSVCCCQNDDNVISHHIVSLSIHLLMLSHLILTWFVWDSREESKWTKQKRPDTTRSKWKLLIQRKLLFCCCSFWHYFSWSSMSVFPTWTVIAIWHLNSTVIILTLALSHKRIKKSFSWNKNKRNMILNEFDCFRLIIGWPSFGWCSRFDFCPLIRLLRLLIKQGNNGNDRTLRFHCFDKNLLMALKRIERDYNSSLVKSRSKSNKWRWRKNCSWHK